MSETRPRLSKGYVLPMRTICKVLEDGSLALDCGHVVQKRLRHLQQAKRTRCPACEPQLPVDEQPHQR